MVSVNRLFAASLSEIESAAADCGLTSTSSQLAHSHTEKILIIHCSCRQSGYLLGLQFVHTETVNCAVENLNLRAKFGEAKEWAVGRGWERLVAEPEQ